MYLKGIIFTLAPKKKTALHLIEKNKTKKFVEEDVV